MMYLISPHYIIVFFWLLISPYHSLPFVSIYHVIYFDYSEYRLFFFFNNYFCRMKNIDVACFDANFVTSDSINQVC